MEREKRRAFTLFPKDSQECPRSEVQYSLGGISEDGVQQLLMLGPSLSIHSFIEYSLSP